MSNQGLYKLSGGGKKRICPNLCPFCVHLGSVERGMYAGWEYCNKLGKLLSNPHTANGRCADFERGEQRVSDETLTAWRKSAEDWQAWVNERETGGAA